MRPGSSVCARNSYGFIAGCDWMCATHEFTGCEKAGSTLRPSPPKEERELYPDQVGAIHKQVTRAEFQLATFADVPGGVRPSPGATSSSVAGSLKFRKLFG